MRLQKIILFLLVLAPVLFTVLIQNAYSLSAETKCKEGHVLVLRTVQKYACVFDSTATLWENLGMAQQVMQQEPVQETQKQESELFALIPFGNESKQDDLKVIVPDTETQNKVQNQLDLLEFKIAQMRELAANKDIINAVIDSNKKFDAMKDPAAYIDRNEQEWIKTPKNTESPLMGALMGGKVSSMLKDKSVIPTTQFGDVLFPEIIVTNSYGANVAISHRTEDYNQADESWWVRAKSENVQIRDVTWDKSAEIYSADIIIKIVDEKGNFIGVLKAITPIRDV